MSYAFGGTCDAHMTLAAQPALSYADLGAATVTRFTVVTGVAAIDELDAQKLRRWIDGQNPASGESRGRPHHSANADLLLDGTINFPKSYSVAALINADLAVAFEALQDRLRDRIVVLWQRELNARRGAGGRIREDIARLEVVELKHRRSRALDPHIHRHLWLNMKVQGADGKWSSLDSRVALKLHTVVNAEGELAARTDPDWLAALAAHGYTLDADGEIAELSSAVRPLSRRSNQIEANRERLTAKWCQDHPGAMPGPDDRHHIDELAWAQGRPNKPSHLDEAEWADRVTAEVAAIDSALLQPRAAVAQRAVSLADLDRDYLARVALVEADARSVSSAGRFSPWDLRAGAIRAVAAQQVVAEHAVLEELIEDVVVRALADTIDLNPEVVSKPAHVKTLMAQETVVLKLSVSNALGKLAVTGPMPEPRQMRALSTKYAKSFGGLDASQLAAASAIAGSSGLVSITGPAGSGKTTLLRVAFDALHRQGRRLVVLAPTRKAAAVAAREVGTYATSVHSLLADHGWRWSKDPSGGMRWNQLKRGDLDPSSGQTYPGPLRHELHRGDRIVVDEAGMVDLHTAHALAVVASQTGSGVAMIGDPYQAAPVGHSGAFAALTRLANHVVELTGVHRFVDPEYAALSLRFRRPVDAADATEIARQLEERGHLRHVATEDAALNAMVDAWFAATAHGRRIALVAATNEAADAISEAIQLRRLHDGQLQADRLAIGRDGQRLLVGDVVQTRRNDSAAGVQNRVHWVITAIGVDRIDVTNTADTTERRHLSHDYASEFVHLAYASTVHGIQGETVDESIVGPGVDAAGFYVGLTRGRESNHAIVIASTMKAARALVAATIQDVKHDSTLEGARARARIDLARAAQPSPFPHEVGHATQSSTTSLGR
ncbi:AAA family ATPase [Microbacterium sp.]|uniref:AAA family ATPase n=1 Tax=Microbacterium sp. TaxID=51671 RepID=UPI003F710E77